MYIYILHEKRLFSIYIKIAVHSDEKNRPMFSV